MPVKIFGNEPTCAPRMMKSGTSIAGSESTEYTTTDLFSPQGTTVHEPRLRL